MIPRAFPPIFFTIFLATSMGVGGRTGAPSQVAGASEAPIVRQLLSLLDRGDKKQTEALAAKSAKQLSAELDRLLLDLDREFDEMGRQKARSDALEKTFDRLSGDLKRFECDKLSQPDKSEAYRKQVAELRKRDPEKLAAYLADPHVNFAKWAEFKKKQ